MEPSPVAQLEKKIPTLQNPEFSSMFITAYHWTMALRQMSPVHVLMYHVSFKISFIVSCVLHLIIHCHHWPTLLFVPLPYPIHPTPPYSQPVTVLSCCHVTKHWLAKTVGVLGKKYTVTWSVYLDEFNASVPLRYCVV